MTETVAGHQFWVEVLLVIADIGIMCGLFIPNRSILSHVNK